MIYLDNAATTWPKPPEVTMAVQRAMSEYGANPGRGGHRMAMAAGGEIYRCREVAAEMFGAEDETRVIFTSNCTMALNTVIKGVFSKGGRAVISSLEHNAVLRPLHALSPCSPMYDIACVVSGDDEATLKHFHTCITPKTKAIICTHASNVTGEVLPIRRIGELAHRHGLLFVVDGAQSAGILDIDMKRDNIDFLCLPGHKGLYGPMGTGMLICSSRFELPPLMLGGTGSLSRLPTQPNELPERLESGTLNLPGICGLRAGIEFVKKQGRQAVYDQEKEHIKYLLKNINRCDGVKLYTEDKGAVPLLSFNFADHHSERVAAYLSENDIAVRAGLHCAPLAHKQMGTLEQGVVRIAPSVYTSRREMDYVGKKLQEYEKN